MVLEFSLDEGWGQWGSGAVGQWGSGAVGGRKSYLGPAEIASFSSRSFSHLNQI